MTAGLTPDRVALHAARIRARVHDAVHDVGGGQATLGPVLAHRDEVAAPGQLVPHRRAVAAFQHQLARAWRPVARSCSASARRGTMACRSRPGCRAGDAPAAGRRSATTGPAARRPACRTPSRACRPATPSTGTASCAGACRGARLLGSPGRSQNICPRVPRQKPRPGIAGEDCSQPPDGVALTMLPHRSITSICTVSAPVTPIRATVGSPAPGARVSMSARAAASWSTQGDRLSAVPGRSANDASAPTRRRRASL